MTRSERFARLAELVGSPAAARGHVELLWDNWNWGQCCGHVEDIEASAHWKGERGRLVDALLATGFLSVCPESGFYEVEPVELPVAHLPWEDSDTLSHDDNPPQAGTTK